MYVNTETANQALKTLQTGQDNTYEAANQLATRILIELNDNELAHQLEDGLTDWLFNGDYDGDETIQSLIAEWEEANS